MRDWLQVGTKDEVNRLGRVLDKTPHEIAVRVAHYEIAYGSIIDEMHGGYVGKCIRAVIFRAVRDTIAEHSR